MCLFSLDLSRCWASATDESRLNLIPSHVFFSLQDWSARWIIQWYAWDIPKKSIDDIYPHLMYFSTFSFFLTETINSCDKHLHQLLSQAAIRQLCFASVIKCLWRNFCPHFSSLSGFYGITAHLFVTALADPLQPNSGKSIAYVLYFPLPQFQSPTCIWKMNTSHHLKLCQIQQGSSFSTMKSSLQGECGQFWMS